MNGPEGNSGEAGVFQAVGGSASGRPTERFCAMFAGTLRELEETTE